MAARGHTVVLFLVAAAFGQAWAQAPLDTLRRYVASVDDATGLITLRWDAAADSAVAGYCVYTDSVGDDGVTRWVSVDTLNSRLDTVFVAHGFGTGVANLFRVKSFDTTFTRNSAMTMPFGNMVLTASMSPCDASAAVSWTPYGGMPGGVSAYKVKARYSADGPWVEAGQRPAYGSTALAVPIPDSATVVSLRVEAASSTEYGLVALSNRFDFRRPTADSALFLQADSAWFDERSIEAVVRFKADSTFVTDYTLYRAALGWPMNRVATLPFSPDGVVEYRDPHVNRSDSLYCYLLSATDGCGLNEKFSDTLCLTMPPPVEPAWYFPNVITPDAEGANTRFCPAFAGLLAEGYELWIYDRMGRLMFHSTDPAECWDGTSPDGLRLPQGAYPYVFHGRFVDRSKHTLAGTVTILR